MTKGEEWITCVILLCTHRVRDSNQEEIMGIKGGLAPFSNPSFIDNSPVVEEGNSRNNNGSARDQQQHLGNVIHYKRSTKRVKVKKGITPWPKREYNILIHVLLLD